MHYGYHIEVVESFIFDRGVNTFKDFIMDFYNQKMVAASAAERHSAKLTMNSIFGRFGMSNERDKIKIVDLEEYNKIELLFDIKSYIQLDKKILVRYSKLPSRIKCEQNGKDYDLELLKYSDSEDSIINSSPIAAATASWARIIMYPYLANAYYSDTDSVFLDHPLNNDLIGSGIGQFKLEYGGMIKKAIFPASKLYLLDTNCGIVSKSKGYSGKLSLSDYISLYKADLIKVTDTRWHKDIVNKTVKVVDDQELVITGEYNKRNKIYSKGRWICTSPLVVNSLLQILPTALTIFEKGRHSLVLNTFHICSLSLIPFTQLQVNLTKPLTPLSIDLKHKHVKVNTKNHLKYSHMSVDEFCKHAEYISYESNMLAGNEACITLYRHTGLLFDGKGGIYYFKGKKGEAPRKIYIRKKFM